MRLMKPFVFRDWVEKHRPELASGRPIDMFGAQFETETVLYGPGETEKSQRDTDVWIWQLEGNSLVTLNGQLFPLSAGDSVLIPGHSKYQWERTEGCVALYIMQNPERKSAYF